MPTLTSKEFFEAAPADTGLSSAEFFNAEPEDAPPRQDSEYLKGFDTPTPQGPQQYAFEQGEQQGRDWADKPSSFMNKRRDVENQFYPILKNLPLEQRERFTNAQETWGDEADFEHAVGNIIQSVPQTLLDMTTRTARSLATFDEEMRVEISPSGWIPANPEQHFLWKFSNAVEKLNNEYFPQNEFMRGSFAADVLPKAATQMATFIVGGGILQGVMRFGAPVAAGLLGAGIEISDRYEDARRGGMSPSDATRHAVAWGIPIGFTEAIGIPRILRALKGVKNWKSGLKQAGLSYLENFGQEEGQKALANFAARTHTPDRVIWPGIGDESSAAGIMGAFITLALGYFGIRMRQQRFNLLTAQRASKQPQNAPGFDTAQSGGPTPLSPQEMAQRGLQPQETTNEVPERTEDAQDQAAQGPAPEATPARDAGRPDRKRPPRDYLLTPEWASELAAKDPETARKLSAAEPLRRAEMDRAKIKYDGKRLTPDELAVVKTNLEEVLTAPSVPLGTPEPSQRSAEAPASVVAQKAADVAAPPEALGITAKAKKSARRDYVPGPVKAPNPDVEARMEAARGVKRETILHRIRDAAQSAWHKATRTWENLPNTPEFASARETLRLLKEAAPASLDEANRTVASIIDPLGQKQLVAFERYLQSENMLAALDRGEPLRFGFKNRGEVEAYRDQLKAVVDQVPELQQAIATREAVVNELTEKLKAADLLPKGVDPKNYYHQQVSQFLEVQRSGRGRTARPIKRTFQKGRVKGPEELRAEYDYNTSYIEAESSWMTDAMVELKKHELRSELEQLYDALPKARDEAKAKGVEVEEIIRGMKDHRIWQPRPGNVLYPGFTIPEKVAEEVLQNTFGEITEEDIKQALILGGPRKQLLLPNELADQLEAMEKPKEAGPLSALAVELMKLWKVWTLLNPKKAVAYNLRNLTGDIDPVAGGAGAALKYVPEAASELRNFYLSDSLSMSKTLRDARDLGVINASLTAQDIPSLKELRVFQRFYRTQWRAMELPSNVVNSYFETVKKFTEYREAILRYAAYKYYLDGLNNDTINHYGGAKKSTIELLQRELGNEVAAAHLSRNLVGDYGNMTVLGEWMRTKLVPFYAWMEVNTKRWPRMAINAVEYGRAKGTNVASKSAYTAAAFVGLAALYAAMQAWNHLKFPDEERDLSPSDRASPHVTLGRRDDGSVRIFRNTGAMGDFLEWFGLNDIGALWPQYEAGQITAEEMLAEMAKAPINKFMQGVRPDLKALFEIPAGRSSWPDVFNPRGIDRTEYIADIVGLKDELKEVSGRLSDSGERARPNYLERILFGVIDPRKSALQEIYDLREKFLTAEGKPSASFQGHPSKLKNLRDAAANMDRDAFDEAKKAYIDGGGTYKKFKEYLGRLDPIHSRLNEKDERKFEQKFLSGIQRQKLQVAREYSQELRVRMALWWWNEDRPR